MSQQEQRLMQVLLAPVVSEKSTYVGEKHKQIVFKVRTDADKFEVKAAVEKMFNVEVTAVRIVNVKAKVKRFAQILGKRKAWKKAYVSLKPGTDINFLGTQA